MNRFRMMIVDDEPLVRSLIRQVVDWEQMGIQVAFEAGSAGEALDFAHNNAADLVLMDVCMPGMNGIELSGELLKINPEIKIIVVSGHDTFSYAQACVRLGVCDYLLKPINEEQLIKSVKRVTENLNPAPSVPSARESIRDALYYVENHFNDPELSLNAVAARFFINASYLSRAIREDTGKSFTEILTAFRMDEAKRLLAAGRSSQEACAKVGIADVKYFAASFKKYTGRTPREFRKSNSHIK